MTVNCYVPVAMATAPSGGNKLGDECVKQSAVSWADPRALFIPGNASLDSV
jgi:hypothetical protein